MEKRKYRAITAIVAFMIALALCVAFVAGCGETEPEPTPPAATVTSIALDTSAVKTSFEFGETFSSAGLKVTATMSDSTTQNIELSACRINPPNMQQPGEQTVVVTHTASRKTASYKVTVKQRPIDETPLVEITGENAEQAYHVEAENINMTKTGAECSVKDGSFVQAFEEEGAASNNSALGNFNVSGNFFAFTFKSDKAYSGVTMEIAIANVSGNLTNVQESLDVQFNEVSAGIKGVLSNSAAVPYTWHKFFAEDLSVKEGRNTVYFNVTGNKALLIDYIDLYVGKEAEVPEKKSYVNITEATTYVQEAEKDLVLTDFVSQGGGANLMIEESVLASGGKSIGAVGANSTFTVGITAQEKATVRIIARIAKYEGDLVSKWCSFMFDNQNIDLGEKTITAGYGNVNDTRFFNWNDIVIGEFDVDTGKTYDFVFNTPTGAINIDALKFAVLTYGEFATEEEKGVPTPNAYIEAASNTIVEAENLDASTWKNTDGAGYGEHSAASNGKSIGHLAAGSEINVNVKLSAKATVIVNGYMAKYESDYVLKDNIKGTFDGEAIAIPDVTLGRKEDGSNDFHNWKRVNLGRYDLEAGFHTLTVRVDNGAEDPEEAKKANSPNIDCFEFTTISYGAFTAEEVAGITVTKAPDKTAYAIGEKFEKAGMEVMLTGADGTKFADVSNMITVPNTPIAQTDTSVTVTYGEYTTTTPITIKNVDALRFTADPSKTEYAEGERFDASGMKVEAIYNDGTTKDVTGEVTYDKLVKKDGVSVSYLGKTIPARIKVTNALVREVVVTENKAYTVEAEQLNRDGVVTRKDFIDQRGLWAGEVLVAGNSDANSGKLIEGFDYGTTFTLKIKTNGAAKISFGVRMAQGNSVSSVVSCTFNGNKLTAEDDTLPAAGPDNWYPWKDVDFGTVTVDKAGEYTFVFTHVKPLDENDTSHTALDSFTFTVTDYAA